MGSKSNETDTTSQVDCDPFYVGYLPLPKAIKRFIVPWLVGNIVLAVGIAVIVSQQHREPGDGTWDTGQVVVIEGLLTSDPYPVLQTDSHTYILVEQGKIGVQDRLKAEGIESGPVTATGFLIEREGRHVLELDASIDRPLKVNDLPGMTLEATRENLGTHTLVGEIVDPKCYLGVMQPGDGKTHKTCATLCIKGGIPPMFLVRDAQGKTAAYLLTDAQGNAMPEAYHAYIADPVELTGRVLRDRDLLTLQADFDGIRRLNARE